MPTIRRKITTYWALAGRRVPAGTPGATKARKLSAKWYAFGLPHLPADKGVPLFRDRAASEKRLRELVREAERGQAGVPDQQAGRRPLADLLDDFAADAAHGLASRQPQKRRPSAAVVTLLVQRVRACLGGCGFEQPADLGPAAPARLGRYLAERVARPRAAGGLSHQSADFHLAAMRRFAWWLHRRRRVPVDPDLFADVAGFDPKAHRVHARRAATAAELGQVLAAAKARPGTCHRLTGDDRAHLYLTAMATGFRAEELSHLTPTHFHLAADPPAVVLPAGQTKNGRPARQPLPGWAAAALGAYLAGRPADRPVWPGTWWRHAVELLRGDLAAAGVDYRRDDGDGPRFLDFHALRHTYVSLLAAAGAGPKELQELARHLDPRLTLGVYTHAQAAGLKTAVDRLPAPPAGEMFAGLFAGGVAGRTRTEADPGGPRRTGRGFGRRSGR